MPLIFLLGLGAISWSSYSLFSGKGYYKGCPPGGFDRTENPFQFWIPTIILFGMGAFALLVALGVIPLPAARQ